MGGCEGRLFAGSSSHTARCRALADLVFLLLPLSSSATLLPSRSISLRPSVASRRPYLARLHHIHPSALVISGQPVPEHQTTVVEEALKAARRVNDYSTAVRIFEGLRALVFPSSWVDCGGWEEWRLRRSLTIVFLCLLLFSLHNARSFYYLFANTRSRSRRPRPRCPSIAPSRPCPRPPPSFTVHPSLPIKPPRPLPTTPSLARTRSLPHANTQHFSATEEKTENAAQYAAYVTETAPLRKELGVLLKEELYGSK
jgi:hypothetical protein